MKRFFLLITAALAIAAAYAADVDLTKPLPRLRLPDGRILENVTFSSFKTTDVVLKHKARWTTVRYEFLPDEIRAEAEKKRPGGPRWFPGDTAEKQLAVEGQVFVTTRGAGAYKFSDTKVYAFASEHLDAWGRTGFDQIVHLPKPLAMATTDADGKFKMNLPAGSSYFLFCQASRMFSDGSHEYDEWKVPGESFKNAKEAFLNTSNLATKWSKVAIEETP